MAVCLVDQWRYGGAGAHDPRELGAVRAAAVYAKQLEGVGEFDLVLPGLGRDGHTASLFPAHDWGDAPDAPDTLAVLDAPEPPPQRVTLSAARLRRARAVWFLVAGDSKREAVARWRAGERLPRRIRPPPHRRAGADEFHDALGRRRGEICSGIRVAWAPGARRRAPSRRWLAVLPPSG